MKQVLVALCLLPAGLLIVGNSNRRPVPALGTAITPSPCDCGSPVLNPAIAVPFSAQESKIPDAEEPAIWRDSKRTLEEREGDLIGRMSLAEKVAQLQNDAPGIPRLGLPAFNYWNEALHGVANNGAEFVKGIQGDNPKYMLAMACAKHYAVHSGPESERHRFDASPPESDFYDTYLPQFERVVRDGHVAGVMGSYNSVYGLPACASPLLLHDLLRTQWGFDGYVVSDCGAIGDIWRAHKFVGTAEEAAAAAIKAGCDLCCGGDYNALVSAVQKGLVTETDVDKALKHTLWTRFRLGLFDPADQVPYSKYTIRDNDTAEHDAVALQLARQSIVLLKNNGILPLDRSKLKRIAVIGPNSDSRSMLEGNYHGSASHSISILNAIKQVAGPGVQVDYAMGSPVTSSRATAPYSRQDNETNRSLGELSAEAVGLAQSADLVIYVGGITAAQEGESFDRKRIELPDEQESLVEALQATGKPIVMVNCSGSAVALGWEDEHLPAILQAWYPGQEGGRAVAEVLFGEVNPSGHLPVTFYRSTADLPSFTDNSMAHRTYRFFDGKPLYAFGHGLSYTTFQFSGGSRRSARVGPNSKIRLAFTIKDSGPLDGDEVAQIYYRRKSSGATGPKLSLCGFQRVSLKNGGTARVSVDVPVQRLRHWDTATKQYVVEPGDYELLIGDSSDAIKLTQPVTVAR